MGCRDRVSGDGSRRGKGHEVRRAMRRVGPAVRGAAGYQGKNGVAEGGVKGSPRKGGKT